MQYQAQAKYPSKHLTQLGYSETHWKGVHALQLSGYEHTEPMLKVYVASQHQPPKRISYPPTRQR